MSFQSRHSSSPNSTLPLAPPLYDRLTRTSIRSKVKVHKTRAGS